MRRSLIGFVVTALAVTGVLVPVNQQAGFGESALSALMNLATRPNAYVGLRV